MSLGDTNPTEAAVAAAHALLACTGADLKHCRCGRRVDGDPTAVDVYTAPPGPVAVGVPVTLQAIARICRRCADLMSSSGFHVVDQFNGYARGK